MSNKRIVDEIERLAQICRKEETNLLIGKYELTLNQSVIQFITNEYNLSSNNNNINIKLNYLRQLFRKIPSIKILGDRSSNNLVIHLNSFVSCVCLQLIRISFKHLVGLEIIRPQLKSLKCFKCFDTQTLDEQFWDLFGVWPQLTSLTLSQNNITSVKASVIPSSVQILDLSWNRIKAFNNIDNYSVNNISKLDLSYNCLTEVPKLNTISCSSLNSLFIRGNLIESIAGIDKLTELIELDIGINCIIDFNSFINSLKKCKSLKFLWIDGNPFTCHPNTNEIIQKHLNFLKKLNEINILRDDQNISKQTNEDFPKNESLRTHSNVESEQFFDASSDSMDSITKSDLKNEMNRKKKLRVIEIKDRIEIVEQLDSLEIKSNDSNDKSVENSSEAKELIQKRKDLGDEWLVSMGLSLDNSMVSQNTQSMNTSSNSAKESNSLDLKSSSQSAVKNDRKISTISTNTTDDEIEVLSEEKSQWSRKELEDDTNIVIVENAENNDTFFVYVREEDGMIFEKDCISGKVLRTHDLKILTNVEIINDLELKICFDSVVYSKREVKYRFDSIESCLGFNDKFIIPWISQRKQQLISEEILYECKNCGQKKSSSSQVICCAVCGSDAIMKSEGQRKRRSGSDITILSQINTQNQSEPKFNFSDETNVWEELFSINTYYDHLFFTRVEHSLKLYIEVKLFTEEEEVVEGLVKCKAMTSQQNHLGSAFLVVSNKNILILSINENENYDNFDAYLKLEVSKPITSLIQLKIFPNLLTDQGFWLEFKDDKQPENRSRTRSLISRLSSKRYSIPETNSFHYLIVFFDQIIGKSFINYFNEMINKLTKIGSFKSSTQRIQLTENSIALNDDIILINAIKSADYKRNDMKSELKLSENIAVIVTEQLVILGEMSFDCNGFYNIRVLYKEFIINLMPQIFVNLQNYCTKLSFSEDSIETYFTLNSYTSDSIKKILIPIKSQWEKAFDVPLPLNKF